MKKTDRKQKEIECQRVTDEERKLKFSVTSYVLIPQFFLKKLKEYEEN